VRDRARRHAARTAAKPAIAPAFFMRANATSWSGHRDPAARAAIA
jgi:hypothetical protein